MRNPNVEILRVVMMALIVMLHLSAQVFDIQTFTSMSHDVNASVFMAFRSFLFLGVSTFALISGYFCVKFSLRKLLKCEILAIFWGGGILLCAINKGVTVRETISVLNPFTFEVCWYLSAYMLLLGLSPILNAGLKSLDRRTMTIMIVVVCVYSYWGGFIQNRNSTNFMLLFTVYLVGRYIRQYPIKYLNEHAGVLCLTCLTANAVMFFASSYFVGGKAIKYLSNNYNPMIIMSAIGLFLWIIKLNQNKTSKITDVITKMAPTMLAVYVIHVEAIYLGILRVPMNFLGGMPGLVVSAIAIMTVCSMLEKARTKLFGKYEERLVDKIEATVANYLK